MEFWDTWGITWTAVTLRSRSRLLSEQVAHSESGPGVSETVSKRKGQTLLLFLSVYTFLKGIMRSTSSHPTETT